MADIAHITLPNGTQYDIKDTSARTDLANKVDKVTGKGLSTNDFTNELKTKLENLPTSFPNFYVDPETMNLIQDGEIQEYEFQLLDGFLIV